MLEPDHSSSYRSAILLAFVLLAAYWTWRPDWLLYLLGALFAAVLLMPNAAFRLLRPFGRLSSVLGKGLLYSILTLVFFLLLTPFAFFYRLFGDTDFRTKNIPGKATFFREPTRVFGVESFRKEW